MSRPKYTPLETESVMSRILAILARGPALTADLAPQLGMSNRKAGWFISVLAQQKRIVTQGYQDKKQVWRLAGPPPKPLQIKEKGISAEDKQWMTYWQLPRAERLRMEPLRIGSVR